jgi:hypothetical protein
MVVVFPCTYFLSSNRVNEHAWLISGNLHHTKFRFKVKIRPRRFPTNHSTFMSIFLVVLMALISLLFTSTTETINYPLMFSK